MFINFYKGNQRINLGFPKRDSRINDVYFKINNAEQPRISFSEARSYLNQGMVRTLAPLARGINQGLTARKEITDNRQLNTSSTHGICNKCGKRLKGNKSKKLCYQCWNEKQ